MKYFGCITPANVMEKVTNGQEPFTNDDLVVGATVQVFFVYGNTAPFPMLKIGDSDPKPIMLAYNEGSPIWAGITENDSWKSGTVRTFTYVTNAWVMVDYDFKDTSDMLHVVDLPIGKAQVMKLSIGYRYAWTNVDVGDMPRSAIVKSFAIVADKAVAFNTLTKAPADVFSGLPSQVVSNAPVSAKFINTAKTRVANINMSAATVLVGKFDIEIGTRLTDAVPVWEQNDATVRIWYSMK